LHIRPEEKRNVRVLRPLSLLASIWGTRYM